MTEPLPTGPPQTCSVCAHWTLSTEDRAPEDFGECRKLMEYHGYGHGGPRGELDPPLDQVVVESDEGWGIFTGPKFSCLHFAAKQD